LMDRFRMFEQSQRVLYSDEPNFDITLSQPSSSPLGDLKCRLVKFTVERSVGRF
jgi:hypothetical protein